MESRMIFREFIEAVDAKLKPYGVAGMPRQDTAIEQVGWKAPHRRALLSHNPKDIHYPVRLGFTDVGVEGIVITVSFSAQMPLPLMLDEYNSRSAAIVILQQLGVDFDADAIP
jgi:hypothetical protein